MWWPKERLPLINGGLILACGGLGALVAAKPVVFLLEFTDWRGGVPWCLGGADPGGRRPWLWFAVPEPRQADRGRTEGLRDQLVGLGQVYRSAFFPPGRAR